MSQTKLKIIENNNMDKENRNKSLEDAVNLIEKNYGKGSIMKLGSKTNVDIEAISTGSLGLDIALGIGGVPKGRIVEIYGPESSGKTTLATHIVAESQKKCGNWAFIDAEHALDPAYAKKLGVNLEESNSFGKSIRVLIYGKNIQNIQTYSKRKIHERQNERVF